MKEDIVVETHTVTTQTKRMRYTPPGYIGLALEAKIFDGEVADVRLQATHSHCDLTAVLQSPEVLRATLLFLEEVGKVVFPLDETEEE